MNRRSMVTVRSMFWTFVSPATVNGAVHARLPDPGAVDGPGTARLELGAGRRAAA